MRNMKRVYFAPKMYNNLKTKEMGGWSNQIGHYEVSQMDYYYDDIKEEGQSLDYYNSKTVKVKFTNL